MKENLFFYILFGTYYIAGLFFFIFKIFMNKKSNNIESFTDNSLVVDELESLEFKNIKNKKFVIQPLIPNTLTQNLLE